MFFRYRSAAKRVGSVSFSWLESGRTLSEAVSPPQQFQQIRLVWRQLLRDDDHR
jgi:hypothetical protein